MPVESNRGPGKGEAFGSASVANALKGLDFPATREQVLECAMRNTGGDRLYWDKDTPISLTEALDESRKDRFESMSEIVSIITEEARASAVSG